MKNKTAFLAFAAAAVFTTPLAAQQTPPRDSSARVAESAIIPTDSTTVRATADLEESLAQLALSLQAVAQRVATDPQLKLAAIKLASSFVSTAQQIVTDNTVTLQNALKTAADRIAAAQIAIPPGAKTPGKPPAGR